MYVFFILLGMMPPPPGMPGGHHMNQMGPPGMRGPPPPGWRPPPRGPPPPPFGGKTMSFLFSHCHVKELLCLSATIKNDHRGCHGYVIDCFSIVFFKEELFIIFL